MAKIIEFYIPKGFHFSESLPPGGLGKVLEFPTRGETPEISVASAPHTAFVQNGASPAVLYGSALQNVEYALPFSSVHRRLSDLHDLQI